MTNWDREKAIAVTGLESFVTRSIVSRAGCCIGRLIGVDGGATSSNPSLSAPRAVSSFTSRRPLGKNQYFITG